VSCCLVTACQTAFEAMSKLPTRPGKIEPGDMVMLVLHSPREKCWGMLDEINVAGVFLRGLDLNTFDDWLAGIVRDEPSIDVASLFFPMWRVERLSLDQASYGIPSMADQVQSRTGRDFREIVGSE
jgi:hypothetical protein